MSEEFSKSYPFLGISRKYNVPYGVVLWHAQTLETGVEASQRHINFVLAEERCFEINSSGEALMRQYRHDLEGAVVRCLQVKSGLRDAYTGELIK